MSAVTREEFVLKVAERRMIIGQIKGLAGYLRALERTYDMEPTDLIKELTKPSQ